MKYLILGDGKLATELQAQTNWDVISRKKNGFDITNDLGFTMFIGQSYYKMLADYDVIVNCIGFTETYSLERKPNWDINYVGVINLANWCNDHDKKLVQISTDYVYAGSNSQATEEDVPVNFKSWYAYTKLLADGYVQAISNDYLLIRTNFKPRPFPWDIAWDNIIGNFDYIDVIAKKIVYLIELDSKGVFNIGTDPKTYYDLAIQTNKETQRSNDNDHNHPSDVTMNLTKFHNVQNTTK